MRSHYWSCTKFANWLRGTPKPPYETHSGWRNWEQQAKIARPFRYWLAEELLDDVQKFIYWPVDKLRNVKYYINNRFVTRTHALTSTLKRGEWHEFDERLLHGMFDELVNFVEKELAWMHIVFDKEAAEKYNAPWYAKGWFRIRTWHSPEAGLDYLDWAANLKNDYEWFDKNDPDYGKSTQQALDAVETKELYNWWKNIRPARPDPYEVSKWNEYYKQTDDEKYGSDVKQSLKDLNDIEDQYYNDDTEMMIRLIRLRRSLWT